MAIRRRAFAAFLAVLGAATVIAASSGPGAMASTSSIHTSLARAGDPPTGSGHAASSMCDPADLPGGSEGPDNDGDECGFIITGSLGPSQPPTDPSELAASEFAEGSAQ